MNKINTITLEEKNNYISICIYFDNKNKFRNLIMEHVDYVKKDLVPKNSMIWFQIDDIINEYICYSILHIPESINVGISIMTREVNVKEYILKPNSSFAFSIDKNQLNAPFDYDYLKQLFKEISTLFGFNLDIK